MYNYLGDIIDKLGEPIWWDGAIPRYCEFHPKVLNNIYAQECALILIKCQSCGHKFKVTINWDYAANGIINNIIKNGDIIEYGDPPNIRCCPAGPTETSDTIKILEFWQKNRNLGWERNAELEIDFVANEKGVL
jgi:hypothetical protein